MKTNVNFVKFSFDGVNAGKEIVTRLGIPVKIITITNDNKILGVIKSGLPNTWEAEKWNIDGSKFTPLQEHYKDLFLVG